MSEGEPLHVLVVDDEPDIRMMLRVNFELDGHRVSMAADGREGFEAAVTLDPDVIVLDVMMPVMDGWEACQRLRRHPRTAAIPIVFCTARTGALDVLRGYGLGGNGYVMKPFSPVDLMTLVASLGRGVRSPREIQVAAMYPERARPLVGDFVELIAGIQCQIAENAEAARTASHIVERVKWRLRSMIERYPSVHTKAEFIPRTITGRGDAAMKPFKIAHAASEKNRSLGLGYFGDEFEVVECEDGAAAYELAKAEPVIVLATFDSDGMDGIELCRWVSRRAPQSVVVLLGSPESARSIIGAYEAGAKAVLVDPFSPRAVRAVLRHLAGLPVVDDLPAPDRFLPAEQLPRALVAVAEESIRSAEEHAARAEYLANDASAALERAEELVNVVQQLVADLRSEDHGAPAES